MQDGGVLLGQQCQALRHACWLMFWGQTHTQGSAGHTCVPPPWQCQLSMPPVLPALLFMLSGKWLLKSRGSCNMLGTAQCP